MLKIKDFLLDENKLSISKINFIVNCLIVLSMIYYRKSMTYMVLLLIGFNMFRMMLKEIIIKKSSFFYFYLIICVLIIAGIIKVSINGQ
jgi:hypothetical protein